MENEKSFKQVHSKFKKNRRKIWGSLHETYEEFVGDLTELYIYIYKRKGCKCDPLLIFAPLFW